MNSAANSNTPASTPSPGTQPPARRVLVVEDDDALREAISFTLGVHDISHCLASNGIEALAWLNTETPAIIVSDVRMPELDGIGLLRAVRRQMPEVPFVLMTAYADVAAAVDAIKSGAREFLLKPFQPETLIEVVERHRADPTASGPVGEDPAFLQMLTRLRRVAGSELSVLLSGESGTGKEVLARDVHAHSKRARGPFVAINCAAIPKDLLEATLFGYEKGAFTGAQKSQAGKFELANGGTLFLDEIGEMPPELQAKLLRVLQERVVERVGSHQEISLDFRLVAATNRRLEQAVREGRFREDLYFRIGVFPLEIPPLRTRVDDIEVLSRHFLKRYSAPAGRPGARLSDAALTRMRQHPWPGNVRELENVIQRALLMADTADILPDDLWLPEGAAVESAKIVGTAVAAEDSKPTTPEAENAAKSAGDRAVETGTESAADSVDMRSIEREHILQVLRSVNGSRRRAVELLGISERALRYKLKSYREDGHEVT
jgi:two-component system response regulator FlrC